MSAFLKKIIGVPGISPVRLPLGRNDPKAAANRRLTELGDVTASMLINQTDLWPGEKPVLISGRYNKTCPLIRSLLLASPLPYVVVGTERDLGKESCLRNLPFDWEAEEVPTRLEEGCGILVLTPTEENEILLKDSLSLWCGHMVVLCAGNGLLLDSGLLTQLRRHSSFVLVTEALDRCVQDMEGSDLTIEKLLHKMGYLFLSVTGTGGKELEKLLPTFQYDKPSNALDLTVHRDSPAFPEDGHHHRGGFGLRFGQVRASEQRSMVTEGEMNRVADSAMMLIFCADSGRGWTARLTG